MDNAKLILNGQEYEFPVIVGSENEVGIDFRKLRATTGAISFDPGYGNTGATESAITFINGEEGILRYRGYPIEQVAENASFVEVCYLLIYGKLPSKDELTKFENDLTHHTLLHEDMKKFFEGYPANAHPMAIMAAMVISLATYYPNLNENESSAEMINLNIIRLLAKVKTLAAFAYKKSIGQPYIYPRNDLNYVEDFLHMMFAVPAEEYVVNPVVARALNLLLILHADHEQNCSTSTVRMVGSSGASLFASIGAGVTALWGPLHGGANQAVIQMLERIRDDGSDYKKYVNMAKDRESGFRLMGFGHRVYKNFDPRARILKEAADEVLNELGIDDPLLSIAKNLEEVALSDEYFIARKLYPNVDFYSGIIYRAMGIPTNMFTVMFTMGRLPGWIAQWKEMHDDPTSRINRPRQIYTGERNRDFVPLDKR
ncbi:MAG: citrate synthase [Chloroflexi bacterium]|nr:MAG: citrate (Si)-synthase [Phototrophicales bacterium]RMF78142.1 MAG: citrate synthase [Chloroflexota bacterium]